MQCYKMNLRLLSRFKPIIRSTRRQFSAPIASVKESNVPQPTSNEPLISDETDDISQYIGPILDNSLQARKRRERESWHNKVKKLTTVEEKIFELNMPRYYGWRIHKIEEGTIPYDPLPQAQYMTRTHIINTPGLPSYYNDILSAEELDASVQQIKNQIEDILALEYMYKNQNYQFGKDELGDKTLVDNVMSKAISQHVNRILMSNLSPKYPHLLETQIDIEPRNEAFWFFGGFEVPREVRKARAGSSWAKEWKDDPVNQCIQYYGYPVLQLRNHLPLKEIVPMKDSEDADLEVPAEPLDPRKTGYFQERTRATVVPGFWPGDYNEFGILSYHNRGYLQSRPNEFKDDLDALKAQAVFASFSWLYAQACYQGFSTFQDITYPLVNQSVITNGQWWTFSVYQLNTTTMHIDCFHENKKKNLCWVTEPMQLFDTIEDGKVKGLNEDVLKHLIKFYANAPEVRKGVNMKPNLGKDTVIANIEDPERRMWLEKTYKHLMSKRSRHKLVPEIYHWQKIYLIKFKTRPMDKKREPWEFGINMLQRRLDDHLPEYIPRAKREHHRSKKKWNKTYYPSVPDEETTS